MEAVKLNLQSNQMEQVNKQGPNKNNCYKSVTNLKSQFSVAVFDWTQISALGTTHRDTF